MLNKLILSLKVAITLIPIVILGWVFNKNFAPLGELSLKYDFLQKSPFISKLYPFNRSQDIKKTNGQHYQTLLDDSVYFDLTLPRWFNKATVDIVFKNDNPVFEIKGRQHKDSMSFINQPLENKLIDKQLQNKSWHKQIQNNTIFLQKEKNYQSLTDFINNYPYSAQIAHYNYDQLSRDYKLPKYSSSDINTKIPLKIRGSYTIYTYIKNEDLNFDFEILDINRKQGVDGIDIKIFRQSNQEQVYHKSLSDDGIEEPTGDKSSTNNIRLEIPDLPEGIYKIDINCSDDCITTKINTTQNKIIFGSSLMIANSREYFTENQLSDTGVNLYTNSDRLVISTPHQNSLQDIFVNDNPFSIDKINRRYVLDKNILNKDDLNQLYIPEGDLSFESNGYFAPSEQEFFYLTPPNIHNINNETDGIDLSDYDYIIANYTPPTNTDNDWKTATAEFDLTKLYQDDDSTVQFMFSAPGLNENNRQIEIKEIEVTLQKPPLNISNFWSRFKNYINSLK